MNETKLKFKGLVEAAEANNQEIDLELVANYLETSPKTLKTWLTKFAEEKHEQSILQLARGETNDHQFVVNPVTGAIEQAHQDTDIVQIAKFKDSVTGLQILNEDLQATAGLLTNRIQLAAMNVDKPSELNSLASALCSIQSAFFNKPTTNVQVNNIQASEGSLLSAFKDGMKN